jgi:hypothetical protein
MRLVLDKECVRAAMDIKRSHTELSAPFAWPDLEAPGSGLWSALIASGGRFGEPVGCTEM